MSKTTTKKTTKKTNKPRKTREELRAKKYVKELLTARSKAQAKRNAGYSESYALNGSIDKTKCVIEAKKDLAKEIENELHRLTGAIQSKDLSKEAYRTLIDAVDKLNKNHAILTGNATERAELVISFDPVFSAIDGNKDVKQVENGSVEP